VAGFLDRGGGRVARRGRDLASRKGEVGLVWGPIAGTHRRAALKLTRYRTQRTISWEKMGHGDPQSWEPVGEFNLAVACERGDLPIGQDRRSRPDPPFQSGKAPASHRQT
jgi:hypothetical protein